MADSILKIRTQDGDKPIGYPGLADKPVADKTLAIEGAFADAKVVGDKFKKAKAETDSLKEDLSKLRTKTYSSNKYNEVNAEEGYRNVGGGDKVAQEGSILSEWIEIPNGMKYAVPCAFYNNAYMIFCYSYAFADVNQRPISGSGGAQTSALSVPEGAKYFRASWIKSTTEQRFIGFNTDGSLIPYEDYSCYISLNEDVKTKYDSEIGNINSEINNINSEIGNINEKLSISEITKVQCWGDSLTDGNGASEVDKQYPSVLNKLIRTAMNNIVTYNRGIGGEGSEVIAFRQGAIVYEVSPTTIPESGSVVVNFEGWHGNTVNILKRGGQYVTSDIDKMALNPCTIAGVEGTLLRDSTNPVSYVFTRSKSGKSVTFYRPVPLITAGSKLNTKDTVTVIWSGTNDVNGYWEDTISKIKLMIDNLANDKYIIVGITSKKYHDDVVSKVKKEAYAFGKHFVDVREYMLNYGLSDAGLTPTEQDLLDIKNGEIPASLRHDDVHGNDNFYNIIATLIYKKGQEMGYWK